ncbi:VTDB protein, partial [Nothocercus julius]|nr:VTDB protein [Nothocercus julius]
GKDYVRDKVCQEYRTMGKEDFRALTIIMNSKKFSNASFEEISHLVREIVSLAETCCSESADPSCYDDGSSALSVKSCEASSPFPRHEGTSGCCVHTGLERKLCLAALQHPPRELPRYAEPSGDELCADFAKDPKGFADRFLYEFASDYGQAPLPVLLGSARSFLSMVSTCCMSPAPTTCFLKEKLQRKTLSLLTLLSNRACSRFAAYGKDKMKFSYLTMLAQKTPSASFEEIFPLAEDAAEVFAQCCDSVAEDCMQKKLLEHTAKVCGVLAPKDERLAECCRGKNVLQNYFCISALRAAEAPQLPEPQPPASERLCGEDGALLALRYIFETGRRHPSVPDVFLSKLYDASKEGLKQCCATKDSSACIDSKRQQIRGKLLAFVAEADELCSRYHKLDFLDFKKQVKEALVRSAGPGTAPERLAELAERRADFASHCCSANAPPRYCAQQVGRGAPRTCPEAGAPPR